MKRAALFISLLLLGGDALAQGMGAGQGINDIATRGNKAGVGAPASFLLLEASAGFILLEGGAGKIQCEGPCDSVAPTGCLTGLVYDWNVATGCNAITAVMLW